MIEVDLVAVLAPLVAGRCYPDIAPADAALPYILYQQAGGVPTQFLEGAGSYAGVRMQINVWSQTRQEAATLQRQIEALLVAEPLCATLASGARATYDEQVGYRGTRQDFYFGEVPA